LKIIANVDSRVNVLRMFRTIALEFIRFVGQFDTQESSLTLKMISSQHFLNFLKTVCYFSEIHQDVFIEDLGTSIITFWTHCIRLDNIFTNSDWSHLKNDSPSNLRHCYSQIKSIIKQYLKVPVVALPKSSQKQIAVELIPQNDQIRVVLNVSHYKVKFQPIKINEELPEFQW
jgi:hypothetical protein